MKARLTASETHIGGILGLGIFLVIMLLLAGTLPPKDTPVHQDAMNVAAVVPGPMQTVQPTVTVMEPTLTVGTLQPDPYPSLTPVAPDAELKQDYGAWRFIAGKYREEGVAAVILYDDKSLAGIEVYKEANKTLVKQLAGESKQVDVSVTFRNFVEPDKFRSWITSLGIKVTDADVRAIDSVGNQIALFVSPQPGDGPLPQESLDRAVRPHERSGAGASGTIVGVYYVRGKVDAAKLQAIADDPLVYLADVTPNIVRKELTAAGWEDVDKAGIRVQPPHSFFKMEEIGIWKFSP